MADTPKPGLITRRGFVKGCVGAAALGAVAATTVSMVKPLSAPQEERGAGFPYLGTKLVRGPAKVGLPMIPVKVNDKGELEGDATYLDWYGYCGHVQAPGLSSDFTEDNRFRFFVKPDFRNAWYGHLDGQIPLARHFADAWQGASVTWRSEGQKGADVVTAMLMRIDPKALGKPADPVPAMETLYQSVVDTGFIAFVSFCAHACCVPGYMEAQIAKSDGGGKFWERIYCTCHGSVYDPRKLEVFDFADLP